MPKKLDEKILIKLECKDGKIMEIYKGMGNLKFPKNIIDIKKSAIQKEGVFL